MIPTKAHLGNLSKNDNSFRLLILTAFSGDETNDRPESQSFSMKQDWALIDAVPLFTVSAETDKPATFWTQLAADTPELSLLSPERLQARYKELQLEQPAQSTNPFGPQPPVLDQWSYSEDGKNVVGVLAGGSTLWFPVSARGWLKDDPRAVQSPADTCLFREIQGGWVVALGGAVYELGCAAPSDMRPLAPVPKISQKAVSNVSLATLVAIAGLSFAALGFVAGSSHPLDYHIPPSAPGIVVTNRVQEAHTAPTVQKYSPDSIAERRVLAERRVAGRELQLVRETESVVRIESRIRVDQALLEKDRAGLKKLQQLETNDTGGAFVIDLNLGSTSAAPSNPNDLTIAQQRAQQERRVTGLELQIVRQTERVAQIESKIRVSKAVLEQDKAGLEKIRLLENEVGGEAVVRGQIL